MLLISGFIGFVAILYTAYFLEIEMEVGVPSFLNGFEGALALRLSGSIGFVSHQRLILENFAD